MHSNWLLFALFGVWIITYVTLSQVGWDSVVSIATTLHAGRLGVRIPVGERFSAAGQTARRTHLTSSTVATGSFFRR
jgi:hypothetical protein